jgi:hypothetical protein
MTSYLAPHFGHITFSFTLPPARKAEINPGLSLVAFGLPLSFVNLVVFGVFFQNLSNQMLKMHAFLDCLPFQFSV